MLNKATTTNLKGFAILVVMLGHLVNIHRSTFDYDFRYFAAFAVSIFLILSGYGLSCSCSSNGLKDFFKKRLSGVILPYALVTIMVSIAYGILFTDPLRVLRTITLTNPLHPIDGTMWFIYFICMWYILFFISYSLTKNKSFRVLSIAAIATFIYYWHPFEQFPQLNFQFTLHAFSFAAGVIIGEYKDKISFKILLPISIAIFIFFLHDLFNEYSMLSYEVSCLSFGILITSLFSVLKIDTPSLSFFGSISYEMYLFEGVLLGVSYNQNNIINALMFVFFTTATAYLFKKGLITSKARYTEILNKHVRT